MFRFGFKSLANWVGQALFFVFGRWTCGKLTTDGRGVQVVVAFCRCGVRVVVAFAPSANVIPWAGAYTRSAKALPDEPNLRLAFSQHIKTRIHKRSLGGSQRMAPCSSPACCLTRPTPMLPSLISDSLIPDENRMSHAALLSRICFWVKSNITWVSRNEPAGRAGVRCDLGVERGWG